MNETLIKRYRLLKSSIKKYDIKYRLGQPILEDEYYDKLVSEFNQIANQLQIEPRYSITDPVYGKKVEHLRPVLSLDHGFEEIGIMDFINRMKGHAFPMIVEHKLDGISLSLKYLDGKLYQILTRGNGIQGLDVTNKISDLIIPTHIQYYAPLEVRGELYTTFEEFELIKNDFTSPRNYCASFLHRKKIDTRIKLFFAIHDCTNVYKSTYLEILRFIQELGLPTVWYTVGQTEQEIIDIFWTEMNNKHNLKYPIDGIVLKINDTQVREELGSHLTAPRYAFAVKIHAKPKQVKILDIELSVGKFGNLTPVAVIEPIKLNGYEITRASLHNLDEIERKQYGIGDLVHVEHTGDAVPQISKKVFDAQNKFIITQCPSCKNELSIENGKLKCSSSWDCLDQQVARISHFCSRNAMNIDSLANKKIRELVLAGLIKLPVDLFKVLPEDLLKLHGWNKKSVKQFFDRLEDSKKNTFHKVLFALCIPHVGYGVAKKISEKFNNFELFINQFKSSDPMIPGVGEVILKSIKDFLQTELWVYELREYLT